MRPSIPLGVLLCSVSFAVSATSPPAKPGAGDAPDSKRTENSVPAKKKAPGHKKPVKEPTPLAKPEVPDEEEPAEDPADSEELSECDDCVLASVGQEAVIPAVAIAAGVTASSHPRAVKTAVAGMPAAPRAPAGNAQDRKSWPMALARTLWGLFFVGRPRAIPKTRIRGVTVR
ncbi:MAG: hypothetical protein JWP91_4010 [Fibrobacteres bacterium]|nr:hypothetical protein [Fibrobacterota bacterium]